MKNILFLLILCSFLSCSKNTSNPVDVSNDETAIKSIMKSQEEAWSKGDIESFMAGYWNNEELTFIGSKGLTKGWQVTLNNYKKGYPDKSAMGKLTFEVKEMRRLSDEYYHMIGKYTLVRAEDTPTGHFMLLWKKIDKKWKIVADMSS